MRALHYLSWQFSLRCKEPHFLGIYSIRSSPAPDHSDNPCMLTLADRQSSPTPANPERRRGLRIKQQRPVKLYEPRTARYYPGQTADISASGLRLSLPLSTPIIAGHTLSLHVASHCSFASRSQMVEAKVIWMQREGSQLVAGLELLSSAAVLARAA